MNEDKCCTRCEEDLPAYLDHELDGDRAGEVRRHLEVCSSCRSALGALQRLDRSLGLLPRLVPKGALVSRAVAARLGLKHHSPAAAVLRLLPLETLAPPLGIAASLFAVRNLLGRLIERVYVGAVEAASWWTDAVGKYLAAAGTESFVVVAAALGGVLLIAFAACSVITLRIARR